MHYYQRISRHCDIGSSQTVPGTIRPTDGQTEHNWHCGGYRDCGIADSEHADALAKRGDKILQMRATETSYRYNLTIKSP
jgi:hypothetical protein